jgi:hypothetical protein
MASRVEEVTGLIRSLAWPLVAVLAIYLFYSPIEATLTTLSERSSDIENIKLGSLELKIRTSELPKSSAAVAKSIAGLAEKEIVMLLEIMPAGYGYCRNNPSDSSFDENYRAPLSDLKARKLIEIEEQPGKNEPNCDLELYATLTKQGESARSFIVDLVTAQLKNANSSPSQ